MEEKKCNEYGVMPGRVIVCKAGIMQGEEMFSILKGNGMINVEANALTHHIVDELNKDKGENFYRYFKDYMSY